MADWKIHRREPVCSTCERPFEDGESHYSVLSFADDALGRVDHCAACFKEREEPGGEGGDLVFWRTRHRVDPKRGLAVDFDAVEALFLALDGREETRLAELRYLLSLLLMRKRRLKLLRVKRRDGDERMVVRRPRRQEELEVAVFDLTPERAGELKAELERIFEGAGTEELLPPPATS